MRSLSGCGCNAGASQAPLAGFMASFGVPTLLFVGLFGGAGLLAWSVIKNKMKGA